MASFTSPATSWRWLQDWAQKESSESLVAPEFLYGIAPAEESDFFHVGSGYFIYFRHCTESLICIITLTLHNNPRRSLLILSPFS